MTTVNNRTLSGIISLSDGSGSVIENGKVTTNTLDSGHLTTNTSEIGDMDIDRLLLQEHLNVNSTLITPVWLSYLYGLTSNVQEQISSIATTLLGTNNTWTGSQLFTGNAVNLIFEKTSTSFPVLNSNGIGAIYGMSAWNKALSFLNTSNSFTSSTSAFVWAKQDSSSSAVQLMSLTNSGSLTCAGNVSSPNITSINTSISNLQTDKQDVIDSSNRLDASLVGTGVVSNTEYGYLNGLTANIQYQLDNINDNILADNNTWTGTNIFNNAVTFLQNCTFNSKNYMNSLEWNSTASSLPTYDGNGHGAIQGRAELASSMCLINNNSNSDVGTSAFVFFKMFNASLLTQIAWLTNGGDFFCNGSLNSASVNTTTITSTDITTDDITTDTLAVNATCVFPVGSKLRIQGSTSGTTAPTAGSGGYLYCRGQTTYGNSISSMNAFSNTDSDTIAFDWSKRTGTTTDIMRLYNPGNLWVPGYLQSKVHIQEIIEFGSDYTFTSWTFIPAICMITANCNITMPEFCPEGLRTTFIRKTGNVTIKSARVARNQIFHGGVNQYSFTFTGGTTSVDVIFDANGSWVVFN